MAYLDDHPPRVRQFRDRGTKPSGVIVVHTAESVMDTVDADTGAESVASFIANRTDYGSYHSLVDSNSRVRLVRFDQQAYGDGTGSNSHAIHISFACRTTDWDRMSSERREAFINRGAWAAVEAARWLKKNHGIVVPPRRISRAQSDDRVPGFISHAERDPERRSDPGANFPWEMFINKFQQRTQEADMPTPDEIADAVWDRKIQTIDGDKSVYIPARRMLAQTHNRSDVRAALRSIGKDLNDLDKSVGDDPTRKQVQRLTTKVNRIITELDELNNSEA